MPVILYYVSFQNLRVSIGLRKGENKKGRVCEKKKRKVKKKLKDSWWCEFTLIKR